MECKGCGKTDRLNADVRNSGTGYCSNSCKMQHRKQVWNKVYTEAVRKFRSQT